MIATNIGKIIKRKRIWRSIVTTLAAIVVFVTTYALIIPAITWERTLICELEEHVHTDDCYNSKGQLKCGKEEHKHTDACFDAPKAIEMMYLCGKTEHSHTEDCYFPDGRLKCTLSEHTHDEKCILGVISVKSIPTNGLKAAAPALPDDWFFDPPTNAGDSIQGVHLSKTAAASTTVPGAYDLMLEAWSEGDSLPLDIVLVLDKSSSMLDEVETITMFDLDVTMPAGYYYARNVPLPRHTDPSFGGYYLRCSDPDNETWEVCCYPNYFSTDDEDWDELSFWDMYSCSFAVSRQTALCISANQFLETLYDDAIEKNADHRVSIVTFSSEGMEETIATHVPVRDYCENLEDLIYSIDWMGNTVPNDAMEDALEIISDVCDSRESSRMVLFFTDGQPTGGRDATIEVANSIKELDRTFIYSIGLNEGSADVDFLQKVSSGSGYYYQAIDTDSMKYAFSSIVNQAILRTKALTEMSAIYDTLSEYFTPYTTITDITAKKIPASGNGDAPSFSNPGSEIELTIASVPNQPKSFFVSGFNYISDENLVRKDAFGNWHGNKLSITIVIKPDESCENWIDGTNNYPTNSSDQAAFIVDKNGEIEKYAPSPLIPISRTHGGATVLPETGGYGIYSIYVLGALLMFGALTIGHILWRRREGRGDV